ncbi:capsular polysaccharide synthesis protein [Bifidobacterium mongoliense]|uniref:capsular polysaccharide synthesis protein n=1 Tax=Bifidobacterium mongoliense TaxID=518643 RepID=UPI0030EEB30F
MSMNIPFTIAKILKRIPLVAPLARKFNTNRHEAIGNRISALCSKVENEQTDVPQPLALNDGPIWVLWWQGEERAPQVVKACIASIRKHAGDRSTIVITQDNVRKYAQLPDYIYTKLDAGSITLTHFSDILRFNLLRYHGGLWMDATLFVTKPLNTARYFGAFFTCSGYPDPSYFFVTKGQWTGFFIGGSRNEPLFAFMDDFFRLYWQENDKLIDYFLIDYVLDYARTHRIGSLADWVDREKGKDNPELFGLASRIAQPYDPMVWKELSQNTGVYKLSWKKPSHYPEHSFGDILLSPYVR